MEEGYCLSRLCARVVLCFNFVVLDVFVLSLDLMSFQIERWRIAVVRGVWILETISCDHAFSK